MEEESKSNDGDTIMRDANEPSPPVDQSKTPTKLSSSDVLTYAFLTMPELNSALDDGERYIHGDETSLDVCDLYGVLLSWQTQCTRLSNQLCSLMRVHKTMQARSMKLKETLEKAFALAAEGDIHKLILLLNTQPIQHKYHSMKLKNSELKYPDVQYN